MNPTLSGLHHVTAITADAQANVDFYCGVLGLRLVKRTVNFDDPGSYHLYYGDDQGRPGTVMTFFAWTGAPRGRVGPPQATATAFAVPRDALAFWAGRLGGRAVRETRFGDPVLALADPDGIRIELVGTEADERPAPGGGPVPADAAIRGLHGVTLAEEGHESTARLLTDVMGFSEAESEGNRFRYIASGGGPASVVDLLCTPDAMRGRVAAGTVHHVAFRTPDDAQERSWRGGLIGRGLNVSPVMDRQYFHSIYYREPGGVLFEIATDAPGFSTDEAPAELGMGLKLPPWLEPRRAEVEIRLPPLRLPPWG